MNNQQGTSLSEIMIGLFLASLMMIALMNHYISAKRQYLHLQTALDNSMELQLAADFMRDSIRQAGFTPCVSINHLSTDNIIAIERDKNALHINRMSPNFELVTHISSPTQLLATHGNLIHPSRPILIADCYHAEVQIVKEVNHVSKDQLITLSNPMVFAYQPPVYIGEWLQETFYVPSQGGLFYRLGHHADELTSVINTMSVEVQNKVVKMRLGLSDGHTVNLETRVRAQ